jgi:hypothetical protein
MWGAFLSRRLRGLVCWTSSWAAACRDPRCVRASTTSKRGELDPVGAVAGAAYAKRSANLLVPVNLVCITTWHDLILPAASCVHPLTWSLDLNFPTCFALVLPLTPAGTRWHEALNALVSTVCMSVHHPSREACCSPLPCHATCPRFPGHTPGFACSSLPMQPLPHRFCCCFQSIAPPSVNVVLP